MTPEPVRLGDVEMTATPGLLLVMLTLTGAGGVCDRAVEAFVCMLTPAVMFAAAEIGGALIVAVICWVCGLLDALNPAGCVMVRFVEPALTGWKLKVPDVDAGPKVTGVVTVPTPVAELATVTWGDPMPGLTVV